MLNLKHQKLNLILFLLIGVGYFSAMSNLEIHYFLKSVIAIFPMQIAALIYTSGHRWSRR